jgi:hypothetical protein
LRCFRIEAEIELATLAELRARLVLFFAPLSPRANPRRYNVAMTKRAIETQQRRLARLARGETRIHERLLGLRGEFDVLMHQLDRLTVPRSHMRPPGMLAGTGLAGVIPLAAHRKPPRGIA